MIKGRRMKKKYIVLVLLVVTNFIYSNSKNKESVSVCTGKVPSYLEPESISSVGYNNEGLSKAEYLELLALGGKHFVQIAKDFGTELTISNEWDNDRVNAGSTKGDAGWGIQMFGGFARHKNTTKDAFMSVMCHEMGHLVAGFPYQPPIDGIDFETSVEAQSDHFIGPCLKKVFKEDIEINATFRDKVHIYPKNSCDAIYQTQEARDLCYRISVAIYDEWQVFGNNSVKWGYDNRDKKIVNTTDLSYPRDQCRLDTAFASSLCLEQWDFSVMPKKGNHNTYNCSRGKYIDEYRVGVRSKCWYKPDQSGGTFDPRNYF